MTSPDFPEDDEESESMLELDSSEELLGLEFGACLLFEDSFGRLAFLACADGA